MRPCPPPLFPFAQLTHFSLGSQINNACRNPVDLDLLQANAVSARMELDLRVGAIFSRVQTLELQRRVAALAEQLMSYGSFWLSSHLYCTQEFPYAGPCQFPTLGFVVDQYERVQAFVAEAFWRIHVGLARDDSVTEFSWRRGRLYDQDVATAIFSMCEAEPEASVLSQQTKPTQKWCVFRPPSLPLLRAHALPTQETAPSHHRRAAEERFSSPSHDPEADPRGAFTSLLSPHRPLTSSASTQCAEALYQRGILSYPRTETDQFDREFNFHEMIEKHRNDNAWGGFAAK